LIPYVKKIIWEKNLSFGNKVLDRVEQLCFIVLWVIDGKLY
jgi:hypothetical protein